MIDDGEVPSSVRSVSAVRLVGHFDVTPEGVDVSAVVAVQGLMPDGRTGTAVAALGRHLSESAGTVELKIDPIDGLPIYRQIVNQIRCLVTLGLLKPGAVLPSITELALELGVAPNTISRAYVELSAAGVVRKRRGLGTFVSGQPAPTVERERRIIIEDRIDALLAEAHELNLTVEALIELIHVRQAAS